MGLKLLPQSGKRSAVKATENRHSPSPIRKRTCNRYHDIVKTTNIPSLELNHDHEVQVSNEKPSTRKRKLIEEKLKSNQLSQEKMIADLRSQIQSRDAQLKALVETKRPTIREQNVDVNAIVESAVQKFIAIQESSTTCVTSQLQEQVTKLSIENAVNKKAIEVTLAERDREDALRKAHNIENKEERKLQQEREDAIRLAHRDDCKEERQSQREKEDKDREGLLTMMSQAFQTMGKFAPSK